MSSAIGFVWSMEKFNRSANYRAALDAATAVCLHIGRQRRGASERRRYAGKS